MNPATTQVTVYSRQLRQTQRWQCFGLELRTTKDKIGLLRADATGLEERIFPKNSCCGVTESIRLSLGILLETDQELDLLPSPCSR
jgi:hypothetical protein